MKRSRAVQALVLAAMSWLAAASGVHASDAEEGGLQYCPGAWCTNSCPTNFCLWVACAFYAPVTQSCGPAVCTGINQQQYTNRAVCTL